MIDTLVPVQQNPLFPLPAPTDPTNQRNENASAPAANAPVAPFITSVNTPGRNHTFTTRIDHKFTETHNGKILYQLGRSRNLRQFGGGDRLAQVLEGKTRNTDAIAYLDNYVLSAKAVEHPVGHGALGGIWPPPLILPPGIFANTIGVDVIIDVRSQFGSGRCDLDHTAVIWITPSTISRMRAPA